MANDKDKLEGQRRAIREHIDKHKRYKEDHEKRFAAKTIENAQARIRDLKRRNPHLGDSYEDSWRP